MQLHISKDGQQRGPYSQMQVIEMLREGTLKPEDLAWQMGMEGWVPLKDIVSMQTSMPGAVAAADEPAPVSPRFPAVDRIAVPVGGGVDESLLAERGTRFLAWLVDFTLAMIPLVPMALLTYQVEREGGGGQMPPMTMLAVGALLLCTLALAALQIYLLTTQGQTLGKRVMGVRIVTREGGRNPGFVKTVLLRAMLPGLAGSVPVVGLAFSLVDVGFIFRQDRRCLHDLIADTVVVKVTTKGM